MSFLDGGHLIVLGYWIVTEGCGRVINLGGAHRAVGAQYAMLREELAELLGQLVCLRLARSEDRNRGARTRKQHKVSARTQLPHSLAKIGTKGERGLLQIVDHERRQRGAIAIELARSVDDERGTLVEGTFTSIADVVSTFRWGWLPVSPLITQRFESVRKVADIGSPLLVVHGSKDTLIQPELGRKLFEAAQEPKQFILVEGGSHHNTNAVGQGQYRQALASLFQIKAP